jgi:hypothetical protein
MMNKKLQYKFSPDFGEGVHFQHEWKIDYSDYRDKEKLQEMVAWCYQNWNDDPNYNHEWQYRLMKDVEWLYDAKSASWHTFEWLPNFYLGTDDDQWAVTFKLRWSESIE